MIVDSWTGVLERMSGAWLARVHGARRACAAWWARRRRRPMPSDRRGRGPRSSLTRQGRSHAFGRSGLRGAMLPAVPVGCAPATDPGPARGPRARESGQGPRRSGPKSRTGPTWRTVGIPRASWAEPIHTADCRGLPCYLARVNDTSSDAVRVQALVHRRMGGPRKLLMACQMSDAVRAMASARIRSRYPELSEREIRDELIWELYGVRRRR